MSNGLHVKHPLSLSGFNEITNFYTVFFSKNTQILNFTKSIQWEPSCSMRTDRQTDMTKLIVAIRNFANAFTKLAGVSINPYFLWAVQSNSHLHTLSIYDTLYCCPLSTEIGGC